MACPHVAGAAALVLSVAPGLTYTQLKQVLLDTTDPIPSLAGQCVTGGRLNVYNAISSLGLIASLQSPIDDDSVNGTTGNGDGFINPGETVGLNVTVSNGATDTFTNVNGTISLVSADPYVTITQDTHNYGTISGLSSGSGSYVLSIAPGAPTPHAFSIQHVVTADGSDPKTVIWNFTIYTSATISGTVTELGSPLAGATVSYDGTVSGSVTTAADGSYLITAVDGTYSLVASATGRYPSAAQSVILPPSQTGIDFQIGAPDIAVDPSSINVSLDSGSTIETMTYHKHHFGTLNAVVHATGPVLPAVSMHSESWRKS